MDQVPPSLRALTVRYSLRESQRPSGGLEGIAVDGVEVLGRAPAQGIFTGVPPTGFDFEAAGANRYLWVIDGRGICYLLEEPLPELANALPKHTNLTGGGPACLGGELWFETDSSMWISGGSGRYPPVDEGQLQAAVEAFASLDYEVVSLGWDHEADRANRIWWGE